MDAATERLGRILDRIDKAARRSGRKSQDITLVAVTKTIPFDNILPFLQAGVGHVGENRVQEALTKYSMGLDEEFKRPKLHLIGQLQSNKAKKAVAVFDMIQSLDRLPLAEDLNRHALEAGKKLPCLIEVKISPEESKSGLDPEQLEDFVTRMKGMTSLDLQGLMGIAPQTRTSEEARPFFRRLRRLFETAKLNVLSMGMSSDFEVAIEEGSTMVRIGTALFGARA